MSEKHVFFWRVRNGKLSKRYRLSLEQFEERYEPDKSKLFNPSRAALPHTYYRNKRSGNTFTVSTTME